MEIAPEQEVMYEFKPKKKQDTSVQVSVKNQMKTLIIFKMYTYEIKEEFLHN